MSVNSNFIKNPSIVENGKFVELQNDNRFPPVSVIRGDYRGSGTALSSVDVYPKYAVLSYLTNPDDIKVSLSAENINVNLQDVENLLENIDTNISDLETLVTRSNTLLVASTGLSRDILTNTNDLETLVTRSNTLLVASTGLSQDILTNTSYLPSISTNISDIESLLERTNTLLDVTSASGPATSTFLPPICASITDIQTYIPSLCSGVLDIVALLQANNTTTVGTSADLAYLVNAVKTPWGGGTGDTYNNWIGHMGGYVSVGIPDVLWRIAGYTQPLAGYSQFGTLSSMPLFVTDASTNKKLFTTSLTNTFNITNVKNIFSVFGISTANVDQYLQIYDVTGATPTGVPAGVFFLPANSNFSFEFVKGLPITNNAILVNSITPVDYNAGNNDLFLTAIYN